MKKKFVLFICTLAALLAACQPSQQSGNTSAATESTGLPETTVQTETSVPTTTAPPETTVPTTAPEETTEPTEDLLALYNEWLSYRGSGYWECYMVFRYDGEYPDRPGPRIDTSVMNIGWLYAVDFTVAEVHEITKEPCSPVYDYTIEYIYYVLESEPTKVYCSDHKGENQTLIYESEQGNITDLLYYGTDANGALILCEGKNRIISYDIPTGNVDVLMEAYYIQQFFFCPTTLSNHHIRKNISEEELGSNIYWKGKLYEDDPGTSPYEPEDTYYYFLETGMQWDVSTWEPRA